MCEKDKKYFAVMDKLVSVTLVFVAGFVLTFLALGY